MLNIGQREVDRLKCHISCKFKDKLLTQTCNKSNPEEWQGSVQVSQVLKLMDKPDVNIIDKRYLVFLYNFECL